MRRSARGRGEHPDHSGPYGRAEGVRGEDAVSGEGVGWEQGQGWRQPGVHHVHGDSLRERMPEDSTAHAQALVFGASRVRQRERRGRAGHRPDSFHDERKGHIRVRPRRRRGQHVQVLHRPRVRLHCEARRRPVPAELGRGNEGFPGSRASSGGRLHDAVRGQRHVQVAQQSPQCPREIRIDAREAADTARRGPAPRRRQVAWRGEADDASHHAQRGAHAQGAVGGGAGIHHEVARRGDDTVHKAVVPPGAHEASRLPASEEHGRARRGGGVLRGGVARQEGEARRAREARR